MIKRKFKFLSLLMLATVATSLLGGCGKKETEEQTSSSLQNQSYPLQTNVTLKYWLGINSALASIEKSFGDTPLAKELEKKTGIKVEYIHPAQGQENEQFNLLLAAGDLPDMIEWNWYSFPGGPEKAISDNYILKLNDVINKSAPNLKKYLDENKEVNKMVKTDTGSYYVFPFVRGDDLLMVSSGPIVRKDWLDELGLPVPSTIDEWYTTLKAFKEKKNATAPLSFEGYHLGNGGFMGAFGVKNGLYVENGKVKYGQMEPGYKDFVTTFRKWYAEGLLDKNIANIDSKILDSNVLDGKTGGTLGFAGSSLGKWTNSMAEKNPSFKLVGAPYPTLIKGETPKFGQRDLAYSLTGCVAITATSKNVDVAAKWLDYGYGEEGHMLYNFGIEGLSYQKDSTGYPKYTDLIMKNPDKLPISNAMSRYIRGSYNGPFVQDKRYIEQYMVLPEQKDALNNWAKTDSAKYTLSRITLTPEESSEAASINNEINTYVNEMYLKFIMGAEPIENFDKYTAQLKKLGIDRYLQIQQTALDRYNKR
jgi:putative aldouronate transport system substrate-binding protein